MMIVPGEEIAVFLCEPDDDGNEQLSAIFVESSSAGVMYWFPPDRDYYFRPWHGIRYIVPMNREPFELRQ